MAQRGNLGVLTDKICGDAALITPEVLQRQSAKPKVFEKEVRASSFSARFRYFRGSISEVKSSEDINNYGASSSRVSLSAELLWRR